MAASFDAMVDALEAAEQARAAEMRDLVDNALAATGGGGAIGVELARSGGSDVARVIDDGPGVAPGERERIFDGFAPPRRNT